MELIPVIYFDTAVRYLIHSEIMPNFSNHQEITVFYTSKMISCYCCIECLRLPFVQANANTILTFDTIDLQI